MPTARERSGPPVVLATVTPGLEAVAIAEIIETVAGAVIVSTSRGKVYARVPALDPALTALRTVDNLYLYLGEVEVGVRRVDLSALGTAVASLGGVIGLFRHRESDWGDSPSFVVNASRIGKQAYSRFDAATAVAQAIALKVPGWTNATPAVIHTVARRDLDDEGDAAPRFARSTVELRLDILGQRGVVGWRLTPPSFRFRGQIRAFAPGSILPTVAHALVRMSEPRNDDVFLDPFAGTGTILAERATTDALAVIGTEIESDLIPGLRPGRVGASASGSRVFEADARRLPVRDGTVDAVVSNLPFGRQVLDEDAIVPLYIDAARELRRVMSPNGRAILMTTRVDVIEAAMGAAGFVGEVLTTISLNGQNPSVLRYIRV